MLTLLEYVYILLNYSSSVISINKLPVKESMYAKWLSLMISAPDEITTKIIGGEGIDHFRKWLHVLFIIQWQILKTIWSLYPKKWKTG